MQPIQPPIIQEPIQEPQPQPMQPPIQQQPTQIQQPIQQNDIDMEELAKAKAILGLDVLENNLKAKEVEAEVSKRYPDVPKEFIEKELAKLSPDLAKQARLDPAGLDMIYKAVKAEMSPKTKPDPILDSGVNGSKGDEDLTSKVKGGKANKFELGQYILDMNK